MLKLKQLIYMVLATIMAGALYIYSGAYPIGADVPHNKLTYWLLETAREQSINSAVKNIEVPKLDNPGLLLAGGPDYNDMCVTCHLKPGKSESDMSIGLYPSPPNLTDEFEGVEGLNESDALEQRARRQFWIIKHGIKASGMPAWGPTHDDKRIWAMVAFLQKLPELSPEQYQIISARDIKSSSSHH
jgi:hypothetical protein